MESIIYILISLIVVGAAIYAAERWLRKEEASQ